MSSYTILVNNEPIIVNGTIVNGANTSGGTSAGGTLQSDGVSSLIVTINDEGEYTIENITGPMTITLSGVEPNGWYQWAGSDERFLTLADALASAPPGSSNNLIVHGNIVDDLEDATLSDPSVNLIFAEDATLTLKNGVVEIKSVDIGDGTLILTDAILITTDGVTGKGDLIVNGNVTIEGDVSVGSLTTGDGDPVDLTINGSLDTDSINVTGDIYVTGTVTVTGDTYVDGDFTIDVDLIAGGDVIVTGNLTVGRNAIIDGDLEVGGDLKVGGDLIIRGILIVIEDRTVDGMLLIISGLQRSYEYTGSEIMPDISLNLDDIWLEEGEFTLEFENNVNTGTATVTITITKEGDHFGREVTLSFMIHAPEETDDDDDDDGWPSWLLYLIAAIAVLALMGLLLLLAGRKKRNTAAASNNGGSITILGNLNINGDFNFNGDVKANNDLIDGDAMNELVAAENIEENMAEGAGENIAEDAAENIAEDVEAMTDGSVAEDKEIRPESGKLAK